jgi:hypothetical protein
MLHRSCLRGYAPYAHGLQSGLVEWIILWMTRKRELANSFILFGAMNKVSCLILPIIHAYNAGISRLRLEDVTPVICPTPVGWRDSGHMPDFGWKTRLRSYAQLRSKDVTSVVCPTPIERRGSDCMPDSSQKIWLRSYIPTPVILSDSDRCHDSGRISWLRSRITPLVDERTTCPTTLAVKDFAWLDQYSKPQYLIASLAQVVRPCAAWQTILSLS